MTTSPCTGLAPRRAAWAAVYAALLLALAACGTQHAHEKHLHTRAALSASATLPNGYSPVSELAGDPNGAGVWFWAETSSQVTIFHVDGQGGLTSWPVLTGASYQRPQDRSGLAISGSGLVWFGMNSTLAELDPQTGQVQQWTIPAPSDNPGAEAHMPPDMTGLHAVQGLAVAPDGHVAIAMTNSSSVEQFDPASGTFTQISMPTANDEPLSVAYASDGTLGVALADFATGTSTEAVTINPGSQTVTATVPDSTEIAPYGPGNFIVGSWNLSILTEKGTVSPVAAPPGAIGTTGEPQSPGALPQSRLATVTTAGIEEFPANASSPAAAGASSSTLTVPNLQCVPPPAPPAVPGTPAPTPAPSPSCVQPTVQAMTTDAAGNIWIVVPEQPETVALLAPP